MSIYFLFLLFKYLSACYTEFLNIFIKLIKSINTDFVEIRCLQLYFVNIKNNVTYRNIEITFEKLFTFR